MSLLINRMQLVLPNGATDVNTQLHQNSRAYTDVSDTGAVSRVMVIPLLPLPAWVNITHSEPVYNAGTGTIHVTFTNTGAQVTVNVLFLNPHTLIGPGAAVAY